MRIRFASAARRDATILSAIIILYLGAAAAISLALSPFPGDPDYIYLMSGLDILLSRAPSFYDHPGTPVQSAIAVITLLTWIVTLPWHGIASKLNDVLLHSQFYLSVICAVFTLYIALAMAFFAWTVRSLCGSLTPALIGLIAVAGSGAFYSSFRHVAPEPVLLATTLMLAGLFARTAYGPPDRPSPTSTAILVGLFLALCVTAKITSGPIVLSIFALRGRRAMVLAILAFGGAALFFLAPIFSHLSQMVASDWHILTHRGDYGSGAPGTPSLRELSENAMHLWSTLPELLWGPVLFVMLPMFARLGGTPFPRSLEKVLLVCAAIILASVLLVAKQPRPYYLVPTLGFLCLGVSLSVSQLRDRIHFPSWVAVVVICLLALDAFHAQGGRANVEASEWNSDKQLLERATRSGCVIVPYYAVDLPQWDLYFGNSMTGDLFDERLSRLFPTFVTYHGGHKRFATFNSLLTLDMAGKRFAREKCVRLIGLPWPDDRALKSGALVLVDHSQFHAVYKLTGNPRLP